MFFDEPGWPAKYTKVPMMCDWGRSQLSGYSIYNRVVPVSIRTERKCERR
jgi:hypothetical protein